MLRELADTPSIKTLCQTKYTNLSLLYKVSFCASVCVCIDQIMSARDLARQTTLIRSTLLCVFVSDYVCA